MNYTRFNNTNMNSPTALRSSLSELQSLLLQSGGSGGQEQQQHKQSESCVLSSPWLMRWDHQSGQSSDLNNNRVSIPSLSKNLGMNTSSTKLQQKHNLPATIMNGESGIGMMTLNAKNMLGSASLAKIDFNKKASAFNKGKTVVKRTRSMGGFPMPKLGRNRQSLALKQNKKQKKKFDRACSVAKGRMDPQQYQFATVRLNSHPLNNSHGCFPLPKLRPDQTRDSSSLTNNNSSRKPYSLEQYKKLFWVHSHDSEISREIFSRRLQRCSF